MILNELRILEIFLVIFLAVPLLRPFIISLQSLNGLAWLPLVALGLLIAIFPAYGFRPECLPLLVFALIYSLENIIKMSFWRDRRPAAQGLAASGPAAPELRAIFAFVLLAAVSLPMFVFSPKIYGKRTGETEQARMLKISNRGDGRSVTAADYFLRIYGSVTFERPLIILIPPEIGSAASVDLVCESLNEKGFTVVTYFRKGYDTPLINENGKKHPASPGKLLSYRRVFTRAAKFASFNERGKVLEKMRRADVEFLLSYLPELADPLPPVLLAGYSAGGSALAYFVGEKNFILRHGNVLGAVAVESRLWSAYLPEPKKLFPSPAPNWIIPRIQAELNYRFDKIKRSRVERTGPLPKAQLPVLYLVSGNALDFKKGRHPYRAVFDTLDSGSGPIALAAVESAGPLDYQDFPLTRPVYSFFHPGMKNARKSKNPVEDTAGIIGNYATYLLKNTEEKRHGLLKTAIPPLSAVNGSLYVQSRGLPGLRLQP